MKPEILLIAPTALDYHGNPIKKKKLYLPGLTLLSLASVTPNTVNLTLVNEPVANIPFNKHWDLVGLTGMGSGLKRAWQIADVFRSKNVPVVIGGIAASLAPKEWSLKHADYLICGEAEETWPLFLTDFLNGCAKKEYHALNRPNIETLPSPRYDLLSHAEKGLWRPVQATRGCPFPCDFCSIQTYYDRSYRKRPVEQVVRDVRAAKKTGSRYIIFIDDNIGVDWKYFEELMHAMIAENIFWASQCSLHIADEPEMLELAFKSGCRILSFGIESVNQPSLDTAKKSFNQTENFEEAIRKVREAGIAVSSEMVLGLEEDEEDVFEATHDFIMKNRIPLPRIYIITPVPGTSMHQSMQAEHRIFDYDIANYNGGKVVFEPRKMSAETLQTNYWKLYDKIYSYSAILSRMRGVPRQTELTMRTFILGTNLHYKSHIKQRITPGIV